MSELLSPGFTIRTVHGRTVTIERYLGDGGQGTVYRVDYDGEPKALKWYKKAGLGSDPKAFRQNLVDNVDHGSPSKEFLWPIDVTEYHPDGDGLFGYIMDLKRDGYHEVTDYMLRTVTFKSYKTAIDASLAIISAFRILHNQGYSYQDLNDGNFFINPKTGKVQIADNDNVAPDGARTGIIGKPRYIAPEVVQGKTRPNSRSDPHSMAVILFILFCMCHPLEGKRSLVPCMTPQLQTKLYGTEALFMMDPNNHDNAPDPNVHGNVLAVWQYLPDYMQELFLKAFSQEALQNPAHRPKELDWIRSLVRFRSEVVLCRCGNEIFTNGGKPCSCEACGAKLNLPFRLEFSDYAVPAIYDTRIYRCQLGPCNAADALEPVARIIAKKDDPTQLGIRNLSGRSWNAVTPSGKSKKVAPDDVIPLIDGISFTINNETITIKKN